MSWFDKTSPVILLVLILAVNLNAEPLKLDFDRAWEMALEKNENLESFRDEIMKAENQVGEAMAGALPTVSASGVFQHYLMIPEAIMILPPELTGEDSDVRIKIKQGSKNTAIGRIDINQPLWVAGKIGIAIKLANIYKNISRLGVQSAELELKKSLIDVFYGVLMAESYSQIARDGMELAEKHLVRVESLYSQGMVSEYDLLRTKVALSNTKPQVIEAETARDLAKRSLKLMLGVDPDQEIEVIGDLDLAIESLDDYETAKEIALQNRSELKQLGLQSELYEGQYKVEKQSTLWPSLFLNLNYQTMASQDNFKVGKYEFLDGMMGTVSLQIPLFDGFASKNRAQTAKINSRAALRQKNFLEQGIQTEVYNAIRKFEKVKSDLEAAEENLEQAEKALRIAEVRYTEGVGTQLEWQDSQLQYNSSRVNLLQAKYSLISARAMYDRSVGYATDLKTEGMDE